MVPETSTTIVLKVSFATFSFRSFLRALSTDFDGVVRFALLRSTFLRLYNLFSDDNEHLRGISK